MKIGFDLDGVLCKIDVSVLRIIDSIEDKFMKESATEWYYRERKPLLNANLFMGENDKMIIITSRNNELKKITEKWTNRFYPVAKLIMLGHSEPIGLDTEKKVQDWLVGQAIVKAHVLDEEVDIYFEDSPDVVNELRKRCEDCIIIHYGGRW